MSDAASHHFVGALMREGLRHTDDALPPWRARLVDGDCHALCDALIGIAGVDDRDWPLYMQAHIASMAQLATIGKRMPEFGRSKVHGWAGHATAMLARCAAVGPAPQANLSVRLLDAYRHQDHYEITALLEEIAQARGLGLNALLEVTLESYGFDSTGRRTFNYGARMFTAQILDFEALELRDATGAVVRLMPKARKGEAADVAELARATVVELSAELKRIARTQPVRLRHLLWQGTGRWVPSTWASRYATHPLMGRYAFGLLWGLYDAESDTLTRAFALDAAGQPVAIDATSVAFDDAVSRVGLVHPVELGDECAAWKQWFDAQRRFQPIEQLSRRSFTPASWPSDIARLRAHFAQGFKRTLNCECFGLGYTDNPRQSGWCIPGIYAPLDASKLDPHDLRVDAVAFSQNGKPYALRELPAVVFSEFVYAIHRLHGDI
ncbi:MAG: DUF4132 domain-containing protein [Bradymonadaceae bacterium]|nr:DUF4132 domain-containing protein [Lujinxingiaceae bacterium]